MYNLKTDMAVNELKGLLRGLENHIKDARFNLSSDNIGDLINITEALHEYINAMEEKIKKYNSEQEISEDELF